MLLLASVDLCVRKSKERREKMSGRILEEVHETARGMLDVVAIDEKRMEEYDVLCLSSVPE